tara:strand:+ start:672 stop:995 length:324 start_codon:yes stop_codon:yes gene_type:complete
MMNACGASPVDTECVAELDGQPSSCGSRYAAIPFFVSFQFLGSFVFLNLIVAVRKPALHFRCISTAFTLHLRRTSGDSRELHFPRQRRPQPSLLGGHRQLQGGASCA